MPTAPKKTATKKAATTKAAKKTAKAKTKKTSTAKKTPAKKTPAKVEGLRKPQVRILQALNKNSKGLDRKGVATKASVDYAACTEYLGSTNPEVRAANDVNHFPSLIGLKYIKAEQHDVKGKDTIIYTITAAGKKALVSAN